MADRPSLVKMAVTADIPDIKDTMSRDEIDQRLNQSNSKTNLDNAPKKKTFKITSVKLNDTTDADSMDDLDESHTEMTEDYSSEILDTSRATDYGQETPSAVEEIPLNVQTMRMVNQGGDTKEKSGTDMHSRFRVVKIETKEPFHRGRWVCQDFLDPQPPVNTDKSDTKVYEDANSGSSSAGSSIHYIHGVDDPAKNPLLAGATGTVYTPMQVPEGQVSGAQDSFQPIHPAPNTAVNQPSMSNNPNSQVTSQGYFSDTSQGQAAKPILCQTINQSHSNKSINSVASTDNVQNKSQPTASGQATQGDGHSGNLQHSSQIISGTIIEKDNSNVGGHQQSGVFMPHYSTGHTGQGLPGSSMSIQSVYPPNIQTTSHIGGVSETTTLAQPSSVSNQGGQASNTYQTYVHLGDQQITNTGISQSGHSESVPSTVANSELQHTLNFPQSNSDTERTNKLDLTPGQTSYYSRTDPLKGALAAAVGGDLQVPQEEDQSGSSTVAIDNKIEQAMDLVKSHLMFAVREEVEVLKEQISELIEQNKQLEYENNILKAAASSETLAKLAQPRQQPPSSSS